MVCLFVFQQVYEMRLNDDYNSKKQTNEAVDQFNTHLQMSSEEASTRGLQPQNRRRVKLRWSWLNFPTWLILHLIIIVIIIIIIIVIIIIIIISSCFVLFGQICVSFRVFFPLGFCLVYCGKAFVSDSDESLIIINMLLSFYFDDYYLTWQRIVCKSNRS